MRRREEDKKREKKEGKENGPVFVVSRGQLLDRCFDVLLLVGSHCRHEVVDLRKRKKKRGQLRKENREEAVNENAYDVGKHFALRFQRSLEQLSSLETKREFRKSSEAN
jgi:hypothetical protein